MTDEHEIFDAVPLPALLRGARNVYAAAIRRALSEAGYDDVPRNGIYVLGGLARGAAPLGQLVRDLAVSKQAVGQLVDTLVLRGYLDRAVDDADRRRLTITLTTRGAAAAAASRAAVERIDASLEASVPSDYIAHTRATLATLIHHHAGAAQAEADGPG